MARRPRARVFITLQTRIVFLATGRIAVMYRGLGGPWRVVEQR